MSQEIETEILGLLHRQNQQRLIVGQVNAEFSALFESYRGEFKALSRQETSPLILLAHADPWHFLAAFLAAIAQDCPVFLANPHWQQREWEQVGTMIQPHYVIGTLPCPLPSPSADPPSPALPAQVVMIPTGGSSGTIRFAIHRWQTLRASVRGFCQYFEVSSVNSCCVLPLYHVSGLMQFLRSFLTQGQFFWGSHQTLPQNFPAGMARENWFLSLVPSQLQDLLPMYGDWLACFGTILVGGAPLWQSLLQQARAASLRLAPTYGMTETGSQVVTLKPQDFLAGHSGNGQVLPHAAVCIQGQLGEVLPALQPGVIMIKAESQYLGYYPEVQTQDLPLVTDDLGYLDAEGYLYLCGRNSRKIISGGENIHPNEVEAVLWGTKLVQDVVVIGVPDRKWGEAIAAIYVGSSPKILPERLKAALKNQLSGYKIPKYWLSVQRIPRNAQGKLSYPQLTQWAIEQLERD